MKKLIIGALAILLVLLLPMSVFSQDLEESPAEVSEAFQELFTDWEMNGYPDNIGHVAYNSDAGKYVIGIVDINEASVNEIKAKLPNTNNIVFEDASYSYNDLLKIQNKIANDSQEVKEVYSMGLGWATIDGQVRGFGESGHEFRVVVSLDETIYDEYTGKYKSEYGDMVYTEVGIGPAVLDDLGLAEDRQIATSDNMPLYLTLLAILTFLIFGGILINRYGHTRVKESADGHDITESKPLGRNQVISAVKKSGLKPSNNIYKSIQEKIRDSNDNK